MKTSGGNYYLRGESTPRTPEEIKIMRARFLLRRDAKVQQSEFYKTLFPNGEKVISVSTDDERGMANLGNLLITAIEKQEVSEEKQVNDFFDKSAVFIGGVPLPREMVIEGMRNNRRRKK
jgi:hypothetical protein